MTTSPTSKRVHIYPQADYNTRSRGMRNRELKLLAIDFYTAINCAERDQAEDRIELLDSDDFNQLDEYLRLLEDSTDLRKTIGELLEGNDENA